LCLSLTAIAAVTASIPNLKHFFDPAGAVATFNTAGELDRSTAFIQPLGTNGRTCESCHQAEEAFSLNPDHVRELYKHNHGMDPLFASSDGANCPGAEPRNPEAHSLPLDRGLMRVISRSTT